MRSPQSKNSRSQVRAAQLERAFLNNLYWLAFLVAVSIMFLPLASHAGEYQVHEAKLRKLEAQMEKAEGEIRDLAKSKKSAADASVKEAVHRDMMALYKQLKMDNADYQETKTHIRFQHPEKGEEAERKYGRQSLQPFTSFDNDVTLDGRLDSFLHKMKTVYGETPKPVKKTDSAIKAPALDPRAPASVEKKKPFNPDDLDQSITLKK